MKKFTNRFLLLGALTLASSSAATAADLVVGPGRTYQTITDAVTAAVDGDRILVMNRTAVYAESPTITKSLTIMSAQEGVYIRCSGDWMFSPSGAGKSLTVMNMNFMTGSIYTVANAPAGARSAVRVFGCIMNGNVSFSYSNFDVTVAADSISGRVSLKYGKVMGNYIQNSTMAVEVTTDATASTDSIWIVGNRIVGGTGTSTATPAIYLNTSSQYVFCTNNLLYVGTGTTISDSRAFGINLNNSLQSGTGRNSIVNNTLSCGSAFGYVTYNYSSYGISLGNVGLNTTVSNNLFVGGASTSYGGSAISGGTSYMPMAYNYARPGNNFSYVASNNIGNSTSSNATINADGTLAAGSDAINGGTPEDEFMDTDLTRNDAGCYGGSLSLANFPRFGSTANVNANLGGRTFFFQAPRTVLQGQTIKVKAAGFDR